MENLQKEEIKYKRSASDTQLVGSKRPSVKKKLMCGKVEENKQERQQRVFFCSLEYNGKQI